jgi:hypothetical protein
MKGSPKIEHCALLEEFFLTGNSMKAEYIAVILYLIVFICAERLLPFGLSWKLHKTLVSNICQNRKLEV